MNASLYYERLSNRLWFIFYTILVFAVVYCMVMFFESKQGSMLKYKIPVSTVDTGYHPSFKVIKSW